MMVQWSLLIPIPKNLVNLDHRSGWHRKTTSETIAGTKNHTTSILAHALSREIVNQLYNAF